MRKKTSEQQEQELEHIHSESVGLIRLFATYGPETPQYRRARKSAEKLLKILENRDRTDRCYYCGSMTKELGIERDTGLMQCIGCQSEQHGDNLERTRQLRDRLNEYGYA